MRIPMVEEDRHIFTQRKNSMSAQLMLREELQGDMHLRDMLIIRVVDSNSDPFRELNPYQRHRLMAFWGLTDEEIKDADAFEIGQAA